MKLLHRFLSRSLLALALAASALGASAQTENKTGPYFVAAAGRGQYDYNCWFWSACETARGNMVKLGGGYRFGMWALEGWYFDMGKATIFPASDSLRLRGGAVTAAWYLAFAPQVDGLLRAGVADVRQSRTGDASNSTFSGVFGLGLVVKLAPAVGLELAWDVTGGEGRNSGSTTGSGINLGLRVSF